MSPTSEANLGMIGVSLDKVREILVHTARIYQRPASEVQGLLSSWRKLYRAFRYLSEMYALFMKSRHLPYTVTTSKEFQNLTPDMPVEFFAAQEELIKTIPFSMPPEPCAQIVNEGLWQVVSAGKIIAW